VYRRTRFTDELTREEMQRAKRALVGLLQRRGFSWHFIEEEGEEALAIAHTEFTRAIGKGVDVEEPVAWTVNCAWRRTQNLLTAESRRPQSVSTEKLLELADEGEPGPEEILEEAERARKIREAVAELNEPQRQVIALTYFEGMSVREAARQLDWHPSKAQYAHKTAIKSLFEHLGVTSSDQLTVEIGLAAFLTFGARDGLGSLPAGVEAVIDRAGHGATGIWGRLQEAARRFGGGGAGDTAGAIASSGAGRAAGVCAAGVAAVCLGTAGVIGGVGIGGGGGQHTSSQHRLVPAQVQNHLRAPHATEFADEEPQGTTAIPTAPSPRGSSSTHVSQTSSQTRTEGTSTRKKERAPAAGISQPRRQWRGTDRALVAAESGGGEGSASDYAATSTESSSPSSSSSTSGEEASASEKAATKSQFDAFAKAR
jgi:RNA polymerase sigma factor (sigma-70 family)